MRTIAEIDADLEVIAAVRVSLPEFSDVDTVAAIDELLDERLQRTCGAPEKREATPERHR